MCIALIAKNINDYGDLLLLHNRDEYHDRAATRVTRREQGIYAGVDIRSGGFWLALNSKASEPFFVAVLNYRNFSLKNNELLSRGALVKEVVIEPDLDKALSKYKSIRHQYSPHSIIIGSRGKVMVLSNISQKEIESSDNVQSFSNGLMDEIWPKQSHLVNLFQSKRALFSSPLTAKKEGLELLKDAKTWPFDILPKTGVGEPFEEILSSIFVRSSSYGTRCSSVIHLSRHGFSFCERSYDRNGLTTGTVQYSF